MSGRFRFDLGWGCIAAMIVRAPWVTQHFDWPMNLFALVGGFALMLGRKRA